MNSSYEKTALYFLPKWDDTFYNKNVGRIIRALEKNFNVTLVLDDGSNYPKFSVHNITGVVDGSLLAVLRTFILLFKKKPSVIFTYKGYNVNLIFCIYKIWNKKAKIIIKADSQAPSEFGVDLKRSAKFWIESLIYKMTDLMLVESTGLMRLYTERGVKYENIVVYRNSFSHSCDRCSLPSDLFYLNDLKFLFFPGRLSFLKGVDLAVMMFLELAHKDIHIVFMN